jgi:hypothetical protein
MPTNKPAPVPVNKPFSARQTKTDRRNTVRLLALLASVMLLLTACASAPTAQPMPPVKPPRLPSLDPVPQAVLESSFTDRMLLFLSGKLPEPISSESSLPSAKPDTKPPSAQ